MDPISLDGNMKSRPSEKAKQPNYTFTIQKQLLLGILLKKTKTKATTNLPSEVQTLWPNLVKAGQADVPLN